MILRNPSLHFKDFFAALLAGEGDNRALKENVSYTGYSRYALRNILTLLGLGEKDEILLPAYICDAVLLPFFELGIKPLYYGITDDFDVDFDTIKRSPKSKAIITVNYFGCSPRYEKIEAFARENKLVWINDNAHGYASCFESKKLEEFGDMSITSLWKVVPSLNGSLVSINNPEYINIKPELDRMNETGEVESIFLYLLRNTTKRLGVKLKAFPDFTDITAFAQRSIMAYRLDSLSGKIFRISKKGEIREKRRRLYLEIESFLKSSSSSLRTIEGLLKRGNSPMACPVVANNEKVWSSVLDAAGKAKFDIHTWPSLPADVIKEDYFGAVTVWKRLLFFPVHQDIDSARYFSTLKKVLHAAKC